MTRLHALRNATRNRTGRSPSGDLGDSRRKRRHGVRMAGHDPPYQLDVSQFISPRATLSLLIAFSES
jgi:hypothetical protein